MKREFYDNEGKNVTKKIMRFMYIVGILDSILILSLFIGCCRIVGLI